ncbi:MAG: hypothetical protein GXP25_12360 [Planctomycetes bacterium]|nr:hypothetical protein [Planctomycetota bacterium]
MIYSILSWFNKHKFIALVTIVLLIWIWGVVGLLIFEARSPDGNPELRTFRSCWWAIFVQLLSGVEEYNPHTVGGRICVLVVLLGGIIVGAVFTAVLASGLVERALRGERVRAKGTYRKLEGHVLIAGWHAGADQIIRELHSPVLSGKRPIVIVTEHADDLPITDRRAYQDIWAVPGVATDSAVLREADVQSAYAAIVLPNRTDDPSADAGSILKALAIRHENAALHICAQVLSTDNVAHFQDSPVDEIVATGDVAAKLLAQAVLTPGITDVYRRLLSATEDSNEVYRVGVDDALAEVVVGKTFCDLRRMLDGSEAILLGIETRRNDGACCTTVNPKLDARMSPEEKAAGHVSRDQYAIKKSDRFLVISYGPEDLRNNLLSKS